MADVVAPFDAYLNTPNKSIRQNVPRRGVCLHHAAMTSFSGLERLAMGAKQVSATAIVKDRLSKRLMTDEFRAWSLSSAWGDSSFRSVETCNQSTDGWTVSDESHWELAYLVAFWAQRDGFWPHRDGDPKTWTVLGHREMFTIWDVSYGTACPGGMDLDLVTRRAQALLRAADEPVIDYGALRRQKGETMYVRGTTDKSTIYNVYTDANGMPRLRVCGRWEAAYALTGDLVVTGYDSSLTSLAAETGYKYQVPNPMPRVELADG